MPRDGSGIYSTPPGTHGTPNTTILSANYNSNVDDVAADLNTPRPIVAGGTGATTAAGALTALGAASTSYVDTQDALNVAKAGDTMTGNLTLNANMVFNSANPIIAICKTASGADNSIFGRIGVNNRWGVILGDATVESGSNAGSNLLITRYADDGTFLDAPLTITRSTGAAIFAHAFTTPGFSSGSTAFSASVTGINRISYNTAGAVGITFRPVSDPSAYSMYFVNAADAGTGAITHTATTTSFVTSSDDRLKEDLQSFDAGNIVDNTKIYDFKWKSTSERAFGVIAQQAQEIYPAAVVHHEPTDWWGVDYSKYVPVLLQELQSLRARVAALEGGGLSGKPA